MPLHVEWQPLQFHSESGVLHLLWILFCSQVGQMSVVPDLVVFIIWLKLLVKLDASFVVSARCTAR